jgi:hypothetical protein
MDPKDAGTFAGLELLGLLGFVGLVAVLKYGNSFAQVIMTSELGPLYSAIIAVEIIDLPATEPAAQGWDVTEYPAPIAVGPGIIVSRMFSL